MSLNQRLRRYAPSTSRLTYHPVYRRVLDAFDVAPRLLYSEFARIPPNHLRIRVGVSNRIFFNQVMYLTKGAKAWMVWLGLGWVGLDSDIVELGVGCGRRAFHMRDVRFQGEQFTGTYLGIDIDSESLDWCRRNFDDRFEFTQSTHVSRSYLNDTETTDRYRIPRDDASVDFVFGTSVFSHLLEEPARNYLEEGVRILRPGGRMVVTCFLKDVQSGKQGRHTFSHPLGIAFVESLEQPEAAVAYESADLEKMALEAGFSSAEILAAPGNVQQTLVCQR